MGDLCISSKKSNDMIESKTKQKESESVLNITLPQCISSNIHAFVRQQQNIGINVAKSNTRRAKNKRN